MHGQLAQRLRSSTPKGHPDPPTLQTDGRTTCNLNTALCTTVHRAAKNALRIILQIVYDMIRHVNMSEYSPSLLGGLNWEGGSFARSQYPTVVYMTFFPNDEIWKFFPGFDGTLSIQWHELKLINIVLSYTMPWRNINNLTK